MRSSCAVVLMAVALAACNIVEPRRAPTPPPEPAQASPAPASEVEGVLKYYHRVLSLKGPELNREYERARQEFEREPSDTNRLQLAVLLSMPGAGFRDDSAAIGLLQPLKERTAEDGLKPLALLMQTYILELRRTEDALQAQSSKLRDEQRRAEALQQKLEALLQMEMKMIEREQAAQPKKR